MHHRLGAAILCALLLPGAPARADEELEQHLASLRQRVEDPAQPLPRRAQVALEMASTLDRAAQSAPSTDERGRLWRRAVDVLDAFNKAHPTQPDSPQFQAQAAIYLWAMARDLTREAELDPRGTAPRDRARPLLDDAIRRLKDVQDDVAEAADTFAQNVRYRLAQVLADRAALCGDDPEARRDHLREALKLLEPPAIEPSLVGYAHLLKGEVYVGLDRPDRALVEADAAAKAPEPPSPQELLGLRVGALVARRRFDEALNAIEKADVDRVARAGFRVRVLLAERRGEESGEAPSKHDEPLFLALKDLRGSERPEARVALMNAAREVKQPGPKAGPEAWEALADGALALGELARAGKLEAEAAACASRRGDVKQAQALRLKAGAILYQGEDFTAADAILSRVFEDKQAGAGRAKAGLLRALARGRALALHRPEASRGSYEQALDELIREFPKDPLTGEARWLKGQLDLASERPDDARAQWMAIAPGSPRWLESRLAVAHLQQEELDRLLVVKDREALRTREDAARRFLTESRDQAKTATEKAELDLALARLDLIAEVGKPDTARAICERIATSAGSPELLARARRLLLLALAELNRFVEAERLAHEEARQTPPVELMETVRWLDRTASNSESDLRHRRFGLLMRVLLRPVMEHVGELPPALRWEAHVRQARALLFTGDDAGARKALEGTEGIPPRARDEDYKDLADLYFGLEAYELAINVQRLRTRRNRTGSLPWFEARYALALAYFRAGREHEAGQLIDATAILHPELGGGELRDKFIRLRQRISPE